MRRHWSTLLPLLALAVSGCSTGPKAPLPVADRVCLTFVGLSDTELGFVLPKTREYLREGGMSLTTDGCQVRAKYSRLAMVAGSTRTLFSLGLNTRTTLGEDGLLTITPADAAAEGEPITVSLRGGDTASDSLRDLASEVVKQTRKRYRPSVLPK
jgi:hypothetical protein